MFSWGALIGRKRKWGIEVCLDGYICVRMSLLMCMLCWVQWGQPSLRSQRACRNVRCLWRVCCLCSTNIGSTMKGMRLHKVPSSPVLLRDPIGFFILLPMLLQGMKRAHTYWWGELDPRLQLKETCRLAESRMRGLQWNWCLWMECSFLRLLAI